MPDPLWTKPGSYFSHRCYATTFSSTTGKTHVYRTKDIERGPWTENSFRLALHDHTLFFDDDGRVYMIYGGGNLRLVELTADVSGLKPGGLDQVPNPKRPRFLRGIYLTPEAVIVRLDKFGEQQPLQPALDRFNAAQHRIS